MDKEQMKQEIDAIVAKGPRPIKPEYRYDAFANGKPVCGKKKGHLPPMGWNSWNAFGTGNTEALTRAMCDALVRLGLDKLGYRIVTDFYAAIAEGKLDINTVLEAYAQQYRFDHGEAEKQAPTLSADQFVMPEDEKAKRQTEQGDVLVIDQNLKGLDFQMARCCQPVYGDAVFGFVTSGGGIKIHREDCPNAPQLRQRFGYRIVRAKWAGKRGSQYPITLRVIGNDDIGIINNITNIISKEEKILLRSISINSNDGLFNGSLTVMLDDTSRLQQLIKKLKTVKGVKNVSRS